MMLSRRRSWVFSCFHPVLLGTGCIVLILYKVFPSIFALLITASPAIICAALLLGILLSYGEPNIPQVDEKDKRTREVSAQKSTLVNNFATKSDKCLRVVNPEEDKTAARASPIGGTTLLHRRNSGIGKTLDGCVHVKSDRDIDDTTASSVRLPSLPENDELKEKSSTENLEFSPEKIPEPESKSGNDNGNIKTIKCPSFNSGRHAGHNHTSLREAWDCIDQEGASSDSESDVGETSDTSVADVLPMLDELDPLVTKDNSDASSIASSQDNHTNSGSLDDEVENQDDEDDEEPQGEKDEGNKVPVTWTADDQRNLVDLGNSELERNRRLENLIAKRRARQILRYEMEKNLIDLEGNDSLPSIEELQRFHVQLPSVYAPRKNPFDMPFDPEEIPGSAPSILRRNPFDIPYEQAVQNDNINVEHFNHQEPAMVPPREFMFRRHESFNVGPSFFGDFRRSSRFRPFFIADRMESVEREFTDLHRQLNEMSDSKIGSVAESDAVSSIADQEHDGHMQEDTESLVDHDAELVEKESQTSEEIEPFETEQVKSTTDGIDTDHDVGLENNVVIKNTFQLADTLGEANDDDDTSEEMELTSNFSDTEKVEVIDEEYTGSSTTSEADEKSSRDNIQEIPDNLDKAKIDDSIVADGDIVDGKIEHAQVDGEIEHAQEDGKVEQAQDNHVVAPVYDSSPTASQKSRSNFSSLDESFFTAEKVDSVVKDFTEPDMHKHASESVSPSKTASSNDVPLEGAAEEKKSSDTETEWVASSLASVDENEAASKEVSMIGENDVLGDELSKVHEDFGGLISPTLPEPEAMKSMLQPSIAVETETSEGS